MKKRKQTMRSTQTQVIKFDLFKEFTHVLREEVDNEVRTHISWLYPYVSAYETNESNVQDLRDQIVAAWKLALKQKNPQVIHHDGEMMLIVFPNGALHLIIPWKRFTILASEKRTIDVTQHSNVRQFPVMPKPRKRK